MSGNSTNSYNNIFGYKNTLGNDVVIKFSPTWCHIESNHDITFHQFLFDSLSYRPKGYYFSPKYQEGIWDGYTRLYNIKNKSFRSGLLSKTINLLKDKGYTIILNNFPYKQSKPLRKILYKNGKNEDVELRSYQKDAVITAIEKRFGIIQAPPRSGKTLIVVAIIDNEYEFPVTFFVRSKDLAYQTLNIFKNNFASKSIGFICDGICEIGDINIITIQSAYSAYNKKYVDKSIPEEKEIIHKEKVRYLINNAKVVFVDECHHLQSSTSRFIMDKSYNAILKLGLSATPFPDKEEAILVEESVGSVIFKISYSELIRLGYLMKPYIYMYKLPKLNINGNYRSIYSKAVINNEFLNELVKELVKKLNTLGKSVVIQTEFIQHTKNMAKILDCEYLVGNDSMEKRQQLINDLNDKKILCLVSTLFEEGLDIASLDYTINLAGGLSNISTFQRMRSITAYKSKTTAGIIDFIHQCKYLKAHSKKRLDLYSLEPEFNIEIRDVSNTTIK